MQTAQAEEPASGHGRNFHTLADAGATLYVAENRALDALKVGVTSWVSRTDRLRVNARHGWRTAAEVRFEEGGDAFKAEQAVLAFLRSCGATAQLHQDKLPQGGYTETIAHAESTITVSQLVAVAETAAAVVQATEGPFYQFLRALDVLRDAIKSAQELADSGHKSEAVTVLDAVKSMLDQLNAALD
ncbi:hypothetical protein [Kitasatospora viridis]|uniref:hypothetical protein n=1 Tax=Kitasatospora viridis TaxID=281105 RepID=UPI00119E8226|nr:hypothetical protein [Kitasatospora viridis]